MPAHDTTAVRQALKCLGSEPAPVPVDDVRRVVLAGGGNEIAMSLYRAMGRGTGSLSEPQIRQRQQEMLDQFEREAEAVLRLLGAFRTVTSLDDYRAEERGLPEPEVVRFQATGTGDMHTAGRMVPVAVVPGATYKAEGTLYPRPEPAPEGTLGTEEGSAGRWEGSSASQVVDRRVQRVRRERVAPDMETCDDCKGTVAWIPSRQQFVHTDNEDLVAYSKDGHIIHVERLQQITDAERLREMAPPLPLVSDERKREIAREQAPAWAIAAGWMDPPDSEPAPKVQQGPAMEQEAQAIVLRAMETAKREIADERARTAHNDRDSGIEPGLIDTSDSEVFDALPDPAQPWLGRVRNRMARARKWLDGYTVRELDELEEHQRR